MAHTRRINGFERPWHLFQIATWVLYPLILVHYYAFLYHLLWNELTAKILLTLLFTISAIMMAISVYFTSMTDPADDSLQPCITRDQKVDNEDNVNQIHCYLCETDVHTSSKHCRYCDKCVKNFDHHCKWLNTCIGEKNYKYFLLIVISTAMLTTESFGIALALTIESFAFPTDFMNRLNLQPSIGSNVPLPALQTLLVLSVVFLFILVAMVFQLGSFHVVLLYRGITTYEFIVLEQKRQREKETARQRAKAEKQQKLRESHDKVLARNRQQGQQVAQQELVQSNRRVPVASTDKDDDPEEKRDSEDGNGGEATGVIVTENTALDV